MAVFSKFFTFLSVACTFVSASPVPATGLTSAYTGDATHNNSVLFVSQDGIDRTVWSVASKQNEAIAPRKLLGYTNITIFYPPKWSGSIKTTTPEQDFVTPAVHMEVTFNGDGDRTFYNMEAINALDDNTGIHYVYHAAGKEHGAGCPSFPCHGDGDGNVFNTWDDYRTPSGMSNIVTVPESELTALVGTPEGKLVAMPEEMLADTAEEKQCGSSTRRKSWKLTYC